MRTISVFGGSGFLGRHVVRALARRGHRVRVHVRKPAVAGFLLPYGDVGQISLHRADVRSDAAAAEAARGADAVVNLVGILAPSEGRSFRAIHAEAPGRLARAATAAGTATFVQMSAIGADAKSPAYYARSKAAGEAAVREAFPGAVILRPSIVFGPEDQFYNRFAAMARIAPALPLIGGGRTRFQPVYVGDVAEAVARVIERADAQGHTYELGGPNIETFREVLETVFRITGYPPRFLPLPFALAGLMGALTGWLPGAPITLDQVRMLRRDNIVGQGSDADTIRTFQHLGIVPVAAEGLIESWLYRFRRYGQWEESR